MAKTKKVISWERKRRRLGYVFIIPFIAGAVFFLLIPVLTSLTYSFSDLQVDEGGYHLVFKGFDNFKQLFLVDPNFRKTLLSTIPNMFVNVSITIIFSFFMASILNQRFIGRTVFRGIFFLPVILSAGIYTRLANVDPMTQMLQQGGETVSSSADSVSSAFVNMLLTLNLDVNIINFLVSAVDRISVIVAMSAIPIIIFLAGFQAISPSIFEASYIEGATKWEVFWKISFPMVSSLILVCVVYTIIDSFTSSGNVMINLIHKTTFSDFKYGLGSAMAWVYMLVIFAIIGLVYKIINKRIFYYD